MEVLVKHQNQQHVILVQPVVIVLEEQIKQHVQLEKLNINLNDEGKAVAKKGGTGEDVLSILKRIGKL